MKHRSASVVTTLRWGLSRVYYILVVLFIAVLVMLAVSAPAPVRAGDIPGGGIVVNFPTPTPTH